MKLDVTDYIKEYKDELIALGLIIIYCIIVFYLGLYLAEVNNFTPDTQGGFAMMCLFMFPFYIILVAKVSDGIVWLSKFVKRVFKRYIKAFFMIRKGKKIVNKYQEQDRYRQTGYRIQFGLSLNKDQRRPLRLHNRIKKLVENI